MKNIDNGKAFDFGRTSDDYAKYRDIYPEAFYDKIIERGLCINGKNVLDIGTGTGVLPRNLYRYGAKWVGTDISENQIEKARALSAETDIEYYVMSAEKLDFPDNTFDVITACQCYWYFNHEQTAKEFHRILEQGGRVLFLCMNWLPFEDKIAKASEELVLKFNPDWTGANETLKPISIPECYEKYFDIVFRNEYHLNVPFTRESWNGRMKSCRGIGASLPVKEVEKWEREHLSLLEKIAPQKFDILHYAAMVELKRK